MFVVARLAIVVVNENIQNKTKIVLTKTTLHITMTEATITINIRKKSTNTISSFTGVSCNMKYVVIQQSFMLI